MAIDDGPFEQFFDDIPLSCGLGKMGTALFCVMHQDDRESFVGICPTDLPVREAAMFNVPTASLAVCVWSSLKLSIILVLPNPILLESTESAVVELTSE